MAKFLGCQLKLAVVDKTLLKQWAEVKLKLVVVTRRSGVLGLLSLAMLYLRNSNLRSSMHMQCKGTSSCSTALSLGLC